MNLHEPIAGAVAGVLGTLVGYPLDVCKTRMQTRGTPKSAFHVEQTCSEFLTIGLYLTEGGVGGWLDT